MALPQSSATIVTITIADPLNPAEVQAWLDNNTTAAMLQFAVSGNNFYIIYE